MNHTQPTGLARPLFFFRLSCLLLAVWFLAAAEQAWGVSWQWQSVDGRERVIIYLDAPGQAKVERTDRAAVTVTLPTPPQTVAQAPGTPNPASSLVAGVSGQGRNLVVGLKVPAFGYITTTPNPRQVRIDFFSDPLGARWKPKPGAQAQSAPDPEAAPAPPRTEQTAPPAPQAPETSPTREAAQAQTQAPQQQARDSTPPATENIAAPNPPPAQTVQVTPQARDELQGREQEGAATLQTARPQAQPAARPQGRDTATASGQGRAAPPASGGGLTEKDITDAPPPTVLDNLLSSLMDNEEDPESPQDHAQARGTSAQTARPQSETTPAAQSQAAQPQVGQSQAAQPQPETTPVAPLAVAGQIENPPAAIGAENAAPPAATQISTAGYAFMGVINPGGPEAWDSRANTLSADTPSPLPENESGAAAPVAPPGSAAGQSAVETPQAQSPETAGAQINASAPSPDAALAENPPVPANETSDALEEVIKNPPPMVSATGRLAQAQGDITAPIEPPLDSTPQRSPGQPAPPTEIPGSTAAGEVFGAVQQHPDNPAEDAHNATAVADGASANEGHAETPPQLDAEGNPIPPPPDPDAMLAEAAKLLSTREYQGALDGYNAVLALPNLDDAQRGAAMYGVSDAQYGLGQDNLAEHFARIVDATERAMNFNLQSPQVPALLMRLGLVNMKMDNLQEAEAYFNMLKRKYPEDPNIPLTYYYWGDYFFNHDDFRASSDQFQYIVQNYPDSKYVREASIGLARSLYNLGYYEQASQVGEYIDRRWPRFYIEFPSILTMFGDTAIRMNKLADAKRYYWTYYNIAPTASDADTSLVHLGDIYTQLGKPEAAEEVYQNAVDTFPKLDGGLIAQMRLVEKGIYDTPLIPEMDALFDEGYNLQPMQVYTHIINDFPDSSLAPLATLKLAMWELWNKRYEDVIRTCEQFVAKYPKHELLPNTQEVLLAAFSQLTGDALNENDFSRILRAWESAPALQTMEDRLSAQVRLALSLSKVNQNKSAEGLAGLDPFFQGAKDQEFGDSALTLALSTIIDTQSWNQIEPLSMRVAMWELKPETKAQLDYARALAFENLNQPEKALPLWEELKNIKDLPAQLQAYTQYFLSRAALRNNDMQNAYNLSRQALQSLSDIAAADPDKADTAKIKTLLGSLLDIAESSGRTAEALEWHQQYAQYVRETDEEWPSLRFRLAQLHKNLGDAAGWSSLLKELAEQYPDTLYGKMAASELDTNKLRQDISDFMPPAGQ